MFWKKSTYTSLNPTCRFYKYLQTDPSLVWESKLLGWLLTESSPKARRKANFSSLWNIKMLFLRSSYFLFWNITHILNKTVIISAQCFLKKEIYPLETLAKYRPVKPRKGPLICKWVKDQCVKCEKATNLQSQEKCRQLWSNTFAGANLIRTEYSEYSSIFLG